VERSLMRLGCYPSETAQVRAVLEKLSTSGVRGLPVGPTASAVLANAVLSRADTALRGTPHLRWVDDYLIFCSDELQARAALERLAAALGEVGLSLAPEKTSIGSPNFDVSASGAPPARIQSPS